MSGATGMERGGAGNGRFSSRFADRHCAFNRLLPRHINITSSKEACHQKPTLTTFVSVRPEIRTAFPSREVLSTSSHVFLSTIECSTHTSAYIGGLALCTEPEQQCCYEQPRKDTSDDAIQTHWYIHKCCSKLGEISIVLPNLIPMMFRVGKQPARALVSEPWDCRGCRNIVGIIGLLKTIGRWRRWGNRCKPSR